MLFLRSFNCTCAWILLVYKKFESISIFLWCSNFFSFFTHLINNFVTAIKHIFVQTCFHRWFIIPYCLCMLRFFFSFLFLWSNVWLSKSLFNSCSNVLICCKLVIHAIGFINSSFLCFCLSKKQIPKQKALWIAKRHSEAQAFGFQESNPSRTWISILKGNDTL